LDFFLYKDSKNLNCKRCEETINFVGLLNIDQQKFLFSAFFLKMMYS
jgi:hypothetical protein